MDLCIEDTDFNKHQILNLKGEVGFLPFKELLLNFNEFNELSTPGSNLESMI